MLLNLAHSIKLSNFQPGS